MPAILRPILAALLLSPLACTPARQADEGKGEVVATLAGEPIRDSELDAWLRDELFERETQDGDPVALYEFRSQGLDRMIGALLLEAESERQGLEISEIHSRIIEAATVSDEEIASFYEENRARIGDASLEELTPRIRDYLGQQKQSEAWSGFIDGLRQQAGVEIALQAPRMEVEPVGPGLGPEGAAVTLVEFSDFNCPYCQRVTPTLKALRERYPEELRIVFRHFPLSMHPRARPIAEATVCADEQGQFWSFHDRVFETGEPLEDDAIQAMAESLGLDMEAFAGCLVDGRAQAIVERDIEAGAAVGVTGTPAFFVNGIKLTGAQPVEAFVRLIDRELAERPEAIPSS